MQISATTNKQRHCVQQYFAPGAWPFWLVHVGAVVGVVQLGLSWRGVALALGLYYARMFLVTAGYHRYFSHRAYKTSRVMQFILGFFGTMCVQKGPLWWAAHHRAHHKFADTVDDPHSPRQRGLLWAHVGWIVSPENNRTRMENVRDLERYPELVWLNRYHLIPVILYAAVLSLTLGWFGFVWGFLVSTVLLWHGTLTINSLTHIFGKRRYELNDDSLNSFPLAVITMGEGWHNNHHFYQSTANQGFYWWEFDPSYYILVALSRVGLVSDLRKPPQWVLDKGMRKEVSEAEKQTMEEAPR